MVNAFVIDNMTWYLELNPNWKCVYLKRKIHYCMDDTSKSNVAVTYNPFLEHKGETRCSTRLFNNIQLSMVSLHKSFEVKVCDQILLFLKTQFINSEQILKFLYKLEEELQYSKFLRFPNRISFSERTQFFKNFSVNWTHLFYISTANT